MKSIIVLGKSKCRKERRRMREIEREKRDWKNEKTESAE